MTWKSRRIRLILAALGVGTASSLDAPTDVASLLLTSRGKQGFSNGSDMAPAAISSRNLPPGLHFLLHQANRCHDFPLQYIKSLGLGLGGFFSLWSNPGWEMILCLWFWGRGMPRTGWMHGMAMVSYQHRIQLCICTNKIFGLLSFIKPGHCESHQGQVFFDHFQISASQF